jgi:dolichol-phosphate mannosyltransferase
MTIESTSRGRVCILLPVLNEAANIEALCSRIAAALSHRIYTIYFVDDGSSDGTVELIRQISCSAPGRIELLRRRKMMRGSQRGSALMLALQWALSRSDTSWIVEMDGDLSHRPEELARGLQLVESGNADVAVASKYRRGSSVINRPAGRRAVSFVCNRAVRLLLEARISDYSNGFRFYTRRAGLAIAGSQIRYGSPIFLSEAMAIWLHDGFRIAEFESTYVGRNEGLSKLRPLDLVKAAIGICEIAWRYHTGRFGVLAAQDEPVGSDVRSPAANA